MLCPRRGKLDEDIGPQVAYVEHDGNAARSAKGNGCSAELDCGPRRQDHVGPRFRQGQLAESAADGPMVDEPGQRHVAAIARPMHQADARLAGQRDFAFPRRTKSLAGMVERGRPPEDFMPPRGQRFRQQARAMQTLVGTITGQRFADGYYPYTHDVMLVLVKLSSRNDSTTFSGYRARFRSALPCRRGGRSPGWALPR